MLAKNCSVTSDMVLEALEVPTDIPNLFDKTLHDTCNRSFRNSYFEWDILFLATGVTRRSSSRKKPTLTPPPLPHLKSLSEICVISIRVYPIYWHHRGLSGLNQEDTDISLFSTTSDSFLEVINIRITIQTTTQIDPALSDIPLSWLFEPPFLISLKKFRNAQGAS